MNKELLDKEFKTLYVKKKKNLSCCVQLYVQLRQSLVNPILLLNDRRRIRTYLNETRAGETVLYSSIEDALFKDVRLELNTGKETTYHLQKRITNKKLIVKYMKLFWKVIQSNLDRLAYIMMLLQTIINPGVFNLIYPFSIFGYALLMETRPPKQYWFFIMLYTQTMMVTEFILSLSFLQGYHSSWNRTFEKYYLGLKVVNGN